MILISSNAFGGTAYSFRYLPGIRMVYIQRTATREGYTETTGIFTSLSTAAEMYQDLVRHRLAHEVGS